MTSCENQLYYKTTEILRLFWSVEKSTLFFVLVTRCSHDLMSYVLWWAQREGQTLITALKTTFLATSYNHSIYRIFYRFNLIKPFIWGCNVLTKHRPWVNYTGKTCRNLHSYSWVQKANGMDHDSSFYIASIKEEWLISLWKCCTCQL